MRLNPRTTIFHTLVVSVHYYKKFNVYHETVLYKTKGVTLSVPGKHEQVKFSKLVKTPIQYRDNIVGVFLASSSIRER